MVWVSTVFRNGQRYLPMVSCTTVIRPTGCSHHPPKLAVELSHHFHPRHSSHYLIVAPRGASVHHGRLLDRYQRPQERSSQPFSPFFSVQALAEKPPRHLHRREMCLRFPWLIMDRSGFVRVSASNTCRGAQHVPANPKMNEVL